MTEVVVVGSCAQDLTFVADALPRAGETRIATLAFGPGGKGSNQAVACHRLGVETLFIGAVGDDPFGEAYRAFAQREGLPVSLEVLHDAATGVAAIVVDPQSQNQITVALGANAKLSREHVERNRGAIEAAKVLLVQLEANLDAVRHALEIARSAGVATILNPAPIHAGLTPEILRLAVIVTPNEAELASVLACLGARAPAGELWRLPDGELAELCAQVPAPVVVLTLGEHGCIATHNLAQARPRGFPEGQRWFRHAAAPVRPVDSTGAGDAFSAGLAAGLLRAPKDFREVVRYATAVAGLSTERPGAACSMPERARVDALLALRWPDRSQGGPAAG
jgi:ribokinase